MSSLEFGKQCTLFMLHQKCTKRTKIYLNIILNIFREVLARLFPTKSLINDKTASETRAAVIGRHTTGEATYRHDRARSSKQAYHRSQKTIFIIAVCIHLPPEVKFDYPVDVMTLHDCIRDNLKINMSLGKATVIMDLFDNITPSLRRNSIDIIVQLGGKYKVADVLLVLAY